jgi:hypothetical protein
VDDTVYVVRRIQSLGFSVKDKIKIIKTAAQSKATYGAAVDPFTIAQIKALRAKYTQALWPTKYTACRITGLLIADKGEIEPGINVIKKVLVNWIKQVEGGLHPSTEEYWDELGVLTGGVRGPINYYRRIIKQLGWTDMSPTNITYHNGINRDLKDWHEFVSDGIKRARQVAWQKSAKGKHNYKGLEVGVDEETTRKYYIKLSQIDPMKAGALHTIMSDGVWTPQRAYKRTKTSNGHCLLCGERNAGVNHLWWNCPCLNSVTDFNYTSLMNNRKRLDNKP